MVEVTVATLLYEKIGIDFQANSPTILANAIRKRREARGLQNEAEYISLVSSDPKELKTLIDSLVVHETWFFRDFEPFVFLKNYAMERKASRKDSPLRALSLPAATGEEPYSIAITFMEAGLAPDEFQIDAVDVSGTALEKAAQAFYRASSFREKDEELRRKYFLQTEGGFRVIPEARSAVRFFQGNILHPGGLGIHGIYDVIFFRNLLVYLHEEARKQAIHNIETMLRKGGILFLGFAEPHHIFFPGYVPVDHPRAYAARKPEERESQERRLPAAPGSSSTGKPEPGKWTSPKTSASVAPKRARQRPVPGKDLPPPPVKSAERGDQPRPSQAKVLELARDLADRGMLADARTLCSQCLETDATCIEARYLLGVIALAEGDEEGALDQFNRVIYLEPDHIEALVHLSLIMDKKGLADQAEIFRKRVGRAESVR